ncbi:MAG: Flp family type IVb pilin [Hyphomicrobiaceae bacterium]
MKHVLRRFRSNKSGVTSIEYAVLVATVGTGIAISANYVTSEFKSLIPSHSCTWDDPDAQADDERTECVSVGGWFFPKR